MDWFLVKVLVERLFAFHTFIMICGFYFRRLCKKVGVGMKSLYIVVERSIYVSFPHVSPKQ